MDATELLSALEANPGDIGALEKALAEAIAEGTEALQGLLRDLVTVLSAGEMADAVLKALDASFRKARDSEAGPVLAWHAGLIAWKVQGDLVRAEFFMRGLPDGAGHVEEWTEFYRQFYASRGNWLRLEQFMSEVTRRTGLSSIEGKRALARTAGQFNNPSKELSYWQALAQAAPTDAEADRELERLYSQLERWPSLADLLRARLQNLPEEAAAEKVATLNRMIDIYRDKMRAEPKVLATYQAVLDVDPGNAAAIDALMTRYEAAGRWPDYAKVLARKNEHTSDAADLIRLREAQAELMETRFANALEAVKAYEDILRLAPERQDVIEKLKVLYDKRRDFENLVRIRKIEADRIDDPAKRAGLLVELAVLATERLRKVPVAIELWEQVLAVDAANLDALRNLEGLYEREKDIDRLCAVLKRRMELARTDAERVALIEKLAGIHGKAK